jgi:hypothetical protein
MIRRFYPLALLMALGLCAGSPSARAQEEAVPSEEGGKGDPLYGYIATGVLAGLAIFAVCKSSRR